MFSKVASYAGLAFALLCLSSSSHVQVEAATHPQDIEALWRFKEEALKMSNNDARWRKVFESWTGRGEDCPYPECPHDPCGEDWHGTWHGVQCREMQGEAQWRLPENVYRRVTNMHIPEWGLPGHLPESLCLFEKLEELDFDENEFEGSLPACVGCLPFLREIDIEDNKFTGTIPREWGNLNNLVEFEIDGNELLAGCIPEGLPKDAEWCGDCWSTCPSYDPYCGSYDCNSCVAWTKDPEIGTSYENTRINGERCPNEPNPPVCPWEIFKEEFEEKQRQEKDQKQQLLQNLLENEEEKEEEEQQEIRSVRPPIGIQSPNQEVIAEIEEEEEPVVVVEDADAVAEPEIEGESHMSSKCIDAKPRVTIENEACVFPIKVMDQYHCDCVDHDDESWCAVADGTWKQCAETD